MPGMVYKQPLRRTEGFVRSLVDLMGVDIRVPDFSTLFVPRVRADIADEIAC